MDSSAEAGPSWALDLDGVIWTGRQPIPGSAEAVSQLIEDGHQVAFVTNNSYTTVAEQEAKLASFGIEAGGRVVTSAMAGASLINPGERVFVLGGPGVDEAVRARDAELLTEDDSRRHPPDAVIVGLDRGLTYDRLSTAVLAIAGGARLVATNTDATYPSEVGFLVGGGAIVSAVVCASGRPAEVAGKPRRPMADLVRSRMGSHGVMIGDRPETDGQFAGALGYDFGLVLSGVTAEADLPVLPEPAWTTADLATMVELVLEKVRYP